MLRASALLVLITLGGPSVTGLLCGISCLQQDHPAAISTALDECHQHQQADDESLTPGGSPCGDHGDSLAPVVTVPPTFADKGLRVTQSLVKLSADSRYAVTATAAEPLGPAPFAERTIPLRI